jgi:hypothetical protein
MMSNRDVDMVATAVMLFDCVAAIEENGRIYDCALDGKEIQHIRNPSPAVQMAAVKNTPWIIDKIAQPTDEVKCYVMSVLRDSIHGNETDKRSGSDTIRTNHYDSRLYEALITCDWFEQLLKTGGVK